MTGQEFVETTEGKIRSRIEHVEGTLQRCLSITEKMLYRSAYMFGKADGLREANKIFA